MARQMIDLTGKQFGKLIVIERALDKEYKRPHWVCRCECGQITKPIYGGNLKNGTTKSCGCLQKEKTSTTSKERWKNNNFKQKHSDRMKKMWEDDNFRQMKSDRMKQLNEEQWEDDNFRQMKSDKFKEMWEDDNFRQKHKDMMKEMWEDDNFRQKHDIKGNKNPNYKGGITPITKHLRNLNIIGQWRKDTYIRENSKCQLTGKHVHGGNSDVHHLYGFNMIVKEAHDLHNIQIKEIIADYTEEELKLLEEYVGSWHIDTSNAVLLSEEVHSLFHITYGYKNNTPKQYIEFKERYLAGEFKEILK